jgi:ssDNA-binding Zn-finger/Zn-ribbon topoisomerase 1
MNNSIIDPARHLLTNRTSTNVEPNHCPRCGDDLQLYHAAGNGRTSHFYGCASYPTRSFTSSYDDHLHQLPDLLRQRLVRCEPQLAWLLVQVEELFARQEKGDKV